MDYIDFFPRLDSQITGLTDEALMTSVSSAMNAFFNGSQSWVEAQSPITIVGGKTAYDIDLPEDTTLVGFKDVFVKGDRIESVSRARFAELSQTKNTPYVFDRYGKQIRLAPEPDQTIARGLTLNVILTPTMLAQSVEGEGDFIAQKYFNVIEAGALFYLLSMPAKTWTNGRAADIRYNEFLVGMQRAKSEANGDAENRIYQTCFNPDY